MTVTREMCIAALDDAFKAGVGRLHAQFIDGVTNKDSDATRTFNRGFKRQLEVYAVAREAIEEAFASKAGTEAPTAMESAAVYTAPSPFKDYVPERKTP